MVSSRATPLTAPSLRNRTFVVFVLLLLVAVASPRGVRAHGEGEALFEGAERVIMPAADRPPVVDGAIAEGEYNAYGVWEEEEEGFLVSLTHNGSWLFVGARQPGNGWIGVAFSSDVDEGANIVTATVNATGAMIRDSFAANVTDEMEMEPDDSLGGTIDVLAFAATSSVVGGTREFAIPLESEDPYDQHLEPGHLYPLVVAFNATSQELPLALAEGDVHFLMVYVARASDDPAAIRDLFAANPSPIPAFGAMAVFAFGTAAVLWRSLGSRKQVAP